MESKRSPLSSLDTQQRRNVDTIVSLHVHADRTNRGFLSNTTNKFQFGILEADQWVGAERLLRKFDAPLDYSVVALTRIKALAITKHDAGKFPQELRQRLMDMMQNRYMWTEERAKTLVKASQSVASMDPSHENYDASLAAVRKRYPAASSYVIAGIRKRQLLKKLLAKDSGTRNLPDPADNLTVTATVGTSLTSTFCRQNSKYSFPSLCPPKRPLAGARNSVASFYPSTLGHSMHSAASIARFVMSPGLVPTLSKGKVLKGVMGSGHRREMSENDLNFGRELDRKKLNQFEVGKRRIQLVTFKEARDRPITPNPFFLLSSGLTKPGKKA